MRALLQLTLIAFCLLPNLSFAWWNDAWSYRMAIGVDASAAGANLMETNENVPVLLKLHTGNFQDFFLVNEKLSDLRFIADDDKTPLKHHVEHFDLINQFIYVWIQLPKISAGINTEKFWMYYGNSEAVSNEDPAGTYDVDTALVYHFTVGESLPKDSTAYGSHASSFDGSYVSGSLLASGISFSDGNRLLINDLPSLAALPGKGMTLSFWVKPTGIPQDSVLIERTDGVVTWQLGLNGADFFSRLSYGASDRNYETAPAAAITPDTWHHIAVTIDDARLSVLVNGNSVAFTGIQLAPVMGNWSIGGRSDGSRNFIGEIDELIISSAARNSSWIKTAVATQGLASALLKPNSAEQLGGGAEGGGLWTVMFTSTDETGWTVIFLLGIMAMVSWAVMIGKFLYMHSVVRDNTGFINEYDKIKFKNPALLDYEESDEDKELEGSPILQAIFGKHDHYQSSSIYRLYHKGIQEVQRRLQKARKSRLNPESIESIKAAVDAQLIREVQRLNSKMVFLTIAISGGPFLGLLGTVLGVMITFAAIALTGDVNISAIAPGVAAALLTTVAGLIVAIPALFGYNYLTTRIKESIADMRVFTDEYITRLAEFYCEENEQLRQQPRVAKPEYA